MPAHKKASGVHTEALLAKHVLRGTASGYAVAHHIPKRLDVFRKNIPHLIDAEPCRECCPRIDGVHPVYAGATFTARFRIYEMGYIFSEYVKTLWYMVRYGIA